LRCNLYEAETNCLLSGELLEKETRQPRCRPIQFDWLKKNIARMIDSVEESFIKGVPFERGRRKNLAFADVVAPINSK
jgi:hypothetical protein